MRPLAPTWDCKAPLNVNDSDLWSDMRGPPAVREKCTDALFAAVRSELGEFLRHAAVHLDFTVPALKPIANDTHEEGGLAELERMVNDKYLRFYDPEKPLHFMTVWTTRSFLARYRLVEQYSRDHSASLQQTEAQRSIALSYALAMLDCDTKIMTSPLTKGYRWLLQFYFPFPACVHIVQDLKRRPVAEHAEHTWEVMSAHYDARFSTSRVTSDDGPFFKIFSSMVLQAWEPREAALRESGQQLTIPRIVSCFQQNVPQTVPNAQEKTDVEQVRNAATGINVDGFPAPMAMGFGGNGLLYGMGGQDIFTGTGLGGISNPGLPGQFSLDVGVNHLNWAAMDWGLSDRRY
ncbi:hypothetical protein SLS56_005308 [Neofusicoccum ribis]|uniref:Uncharacterized protein n=1 Tax=Neofusicoccum ribis TaxID=45134 RepID=A0ABR3SUZ2_9PEZI